MTKDLLASLNPQQQKAVTLPDTSSLILAGAGSGKTTVLIARIAHILGQHMARPSEIMAVTFTNKAAKEMLNRLSTKVSFNPRAMWVGTFHGLCNRFLYLHHTEAGLPSTYTILDSSDQLGLIKKIMKNIGLEDDKNKARQIQNYINLCKEEGRRADDVSASGLDEKNMADVYRTYEKVLNQQGAVDFAELILRTYEVLSNNESLRLHYQNRFKYILVDEFQDTNKLQYKFIKILSGVDYPDRRTNAVFAVGDDDQSIYAFRGANVANMRLFLDDFGISEPIRLEQNYRSKRNILDAANQLIAQNKDRLGKNLWTQAEKGEPLKLFVAADQSKEAAFIADTITQLIKSGESKREIAVLYRANAQSRAIETELTNRAISYVVYGGLRFYERAEIKNSLAYLRLAENPNDDNAFLRVVNVPARGVGTKTVEALEKYASENKCSLLKAALKIEGAVGNKLKGFLDIIHDIREKRDTLHLPQLVEYANVHSGLIKMYEDDITGEDRLENLAELVSSAQAFLQQESIKDDINEDNFDNLTPLAQFLAQATLEAGENQARAGDDAVQLMTVHSSKGLEFNNVFITGLEEGLFPHIHSMNEADTNSKALQEERRLMYVAVTRTRNNLYLTYARERFLNGYSNYNIESRYIGDIPDSCIKKLNPDDDLLSQNLRGLNKYTLHNPFLRESKPKTTYTNTPSWVSDFLIKSEDKQAQKLKALLSKGEEFPVGARVKHTKLGLGTVIKYSKYDDNKRITILFDHKGLKELDYSIVKDKLTPAD